jgi:hypothetical protein
MVPVSVLTPVEVPTATTARAGAWIYTCLQPQVPTATGDCTYFDRKDNLQCRAKTKLLI